MSYQNITGKCKEIESSIDELLRAKQQLEDDIRNLATDLGTLVTVYTKSNEQLQEQMGQSKMIVDAAEKRYEEFIAKINGLSDELGTIIR